MLNPADITTLGAAFIAGLVTSLHCVGMCGPLACAFVPKKGSPLTIYATTAWYHTVRIFSYTCIGALVGFIGGAPIQLLYQAGIVRYVPWVLVAFFLVIALGLENKLPLPKFVGRAFMQASKRLRALPKPLSTAGLGLLTPLMPCGPLYLVFGVAMLSGSALRGAEFMLAFGVGTLPLLYIVHSQYARLARILPPGFMRWLQRGVALAAAIIIALRITAPQPSVNQPLAPGEVPTAHCPMCPGWEAQQKQLEKTAI